MYDITFLLLLLLLLLLMLLLFIVTIYYCHYDYFCCLSMTHHSMTQKVEFCQVGMLPESLTSGSRFLSAIGSQVQFAAGKNIQLTLHASVVCM